MLVGGKWQDKVVRLPVEKRNVVSLEILEKLTPNRALVAYVHKALRGRELDFDLRERADLEMVEFLSKIDLPNGLQARRNFLLALRNRAVNAAVVACSVANMAADQAYRVGALAVESQLRKQVVAPAYEDMAVVLLEASADALINAYRHTEEAFGKCRAIDAVLAGLPE